MVGKLVDPKSINFGVRSSSFGNQLPVLGSIPYNDTIKNMDRNTVASLI